MLKQWKIINNLKSSTATQQPSDEPTDSLDQIIAAVNGADEQAAAERVAALRAKYPLIEPEPLIGMLVKQKCMQVGADSQIISNASVIPGVGVFVSLLFEDGADVALTSHLQAELLLEIAALYDQVVADQPNGLIMVTGLGTEAEGLLARVDQADSAGVIALLNSAAATGTQILSGSMAVAKKSASGVTTGAGRGIMKGADLASQTVTATRHQAQRGLKTGADKIGQAATQAGVGLLRGANRAAATVSEIGQKAGDHVTMSSERVAQVTVGAGRGVARSADVAANVVTNTGKIVGNSVAHSAGRVGHLTTDAGQSVDQITETAATGVVETGQQARRTVASGADKASDLITQSGWGLIYRINQTKEFVIRAGRSINKRVSRVGQMTAGFFRGKAE